MNDKEYRYKLSFETNHLAGKRVRHEKMTNDPWQQFGTLTQWVKTGEEPIRNVHLYDLYGGDREILWQAVGTEHRLKCLDRMDIELLVMALLRKRENDGLNSRVYNATNAAFQEGQIRGLLSKFDLGE